MARRKAGVGTADITLNVTDHFAEMRLFIFRSCATPAEGGPGILKRMRYESLEQGWYLDMSPCGMPKPNILMKIKRRQPVEILQDLGYKGAVTTDTIGGLHGR